MTERIRKTVYIVIVAALGVSLLAEFAHKQFGMWAAIAIHDTSSVVGAGSAYDAMHPELMLSEGVSALEVATTIKGVWE